MTQEAVFGASEADAYWHRNRNGIAAKDMQSDVPMRLVDMYRLSPRRVLEIGAANGYRVAALQARFGCAAAAVDPSGEALADGEHRFPSVVFRQGTAASVPLTDAFDLVIVHYVLHWVDRSLLLRSIAEIDRMVADGGYLIVGDFAPANRVRVPYHHLAPLETYKQDYAGLFVASGLYHPVGLLTSSHGAGELSPNVPEHERYGCWLLRKQLAEHYYNEGSGSV